MPVAYLDYSKQKRDYYENMLKIIGSLSRLFSESYIPYLDSRVAENLFCKAFEAQNKSREDSSVDAVLGGTGIGIKTFRGKAEQKIAEFNKDSLSFSNLQPLEKVKRIAELRNKRIEFTKRTYAISDLKYHCIVREKGKMLICEEPMDLIDIAKLSLIKSKPLSLSFNDGSNHYNFNISKSVLYKKFKRNVSAEVKVEILENPFEILDSGLAQNKREMLRTMEIQHQYILLPLYALKDNKKIVPIKSGLNQWNAEGRKRDEDEVYIRIPAWIHKKFVDFFPARNVKFKLILPNGESLSAKICQQGNKALMSDPNKALGYWILRKVLQQPQNKILTYKKLQELGIDSVIIKKIGHLEYSIDFVDEGKFERFEEEQLNTT